ncbi:Uncharacterised protein [Salmonella enterica subsp. enterica serovar Typhimurium str. DT104]|nr:Uncharacterised protein [Salmonella enterica subsp. enterica serovar Typhimurium str. DT104]
MRCPLRRFGDTVLALTQNISLIMAIGGRVSRKGLFIVADAIVIEKRLVNEIFVNQYPGNSRHQRGIGAGANRYPLVFTSGSGIGIARIYYDHARI